MIHKIRREIGLEGDEARRDYLTEDGYRWLQDHPGPPMTIHFGDDAKAFDIREEAVAVCERLHGDKAAVAAKEREENPAVTRVLFRVEDIE